MVMTAGSARQRPSDFKDDSAIERTFPEEYEMEREGDDTSISNQTNQRMEQSESRSKKTIAPKLQNIFAKISDKLF
jgi:hypothetical protein